MRTEPTAKVVTPAEAAFIAYRLAIHAKTQQKKLVNAIRKALHPELIKKLETDIAECLRLATALQAQP